MASIDYVELSESQSDIPTETEGTGCYEFSEILDCPNCERRFAHFFYMNVVVCEFCGYQQTRHRVGR